MSKDRKLTAEEIHRLAVAPIQLPVTIPKKISGNRFSKYSYNPKEDFRHLASEVSANSNK